MRISSTQRAPRPAPLSERQPMSPSSSDDSPGDRVLLSIAGSSIGAVGAGALAMTAPTQVDKLKHIGVTGAATVALGAIGMSPAAAAGTVFVSASLGKELVYDLMMGGGTPSWLDASANLAGSLAGYALLKAAQPQNRTYLLGR